MLQTDQITVSIKDKKIVDTLSIQVKQKQFVGLIGPNGCGKSTFLKTIYKVLKPTSGYIQFQDMDLVGAKEKDIAKKMGVITQFHSLPFDFSVYQMVQMGRAPHNHSLFQNKEKNHQIVMEALAHTHLLDYKDHSFLSLSGGEKQRVLLARTLAQQPEFLILDEPTNHLDIRFQVEFLSLVTSLNIGTLAVLHNLEQAITYCDYLYILKDGKLVAQGEPDHVLTEELIRYVYEVECRLFTNPITGKKGFVFQPLH